MKDCSICNSLKKDEFRIVMQDKFSVGMVIREPQVDFHCLVVPKRHVEDLGSLTGEEAVSLNRMVDVMVARIEKVSGKPVTIGLNSAKWRTQKHLHFQLLPMDKGLRELVATQFGIPEYTHPSEEELGEMAEKLR